MKRFLIVPSLVLAVLLALCILNAAALNPLYRCKETVPSPYQ